MESQIFAKQIRERSLQMVHQAHASHIGGALSMADIIAVLFTHVMRYDASRPDWEERDRFILSKGHACVSYYTALAQVGFIADADLDTYSQNGSQLMCHVSHKIPGVEVSAGSLGHGLPYGIGMALAAQRKKRHYRTFVLLGDGEMDEGSNWEGLMFAAHHRLHQLCAIIDYNKIQSLGNTNEVMCLEPLKDKLVAFGCNVLEVNGHDHEALLSAFRQFEQEQQRPTVIVAHTVKGKGVSYMENNLAWHYKSPDDQQLEAAIEEIEQ